MEHQKRELLILKNPLVDGENQPRIEPRPVIRPHSACSFVPASERAKIIHSMTPRMRPIVNNVNSPEQQQQEQQKNALNAEMMSLNFVAPSSSSFSVNIKPSRHSATIRPQQQYSSQIIKQKSMSKGRRSVSPPSQQQQQQNLQITNNSNNTRNRMYSTIEIVTADYDDDDNETTTPFGRSTISATTRKSSVDKNYYVQFQAVRKDSASSDTTNTVDFHNYNDERKNVDDSYLLANGPVRDLAIKSVSALAGAKYSHLAAAGTKSQRASFGDQQSQNPQTATSIQNESGLGNQRKSVVSGIFRRTSQEEEGKNRKVKVICHGDVRLKVVENQWNFSPNRRFPKNWKPSTEFEDEEEEDEDEEDEQQKLLHGDFGVSEARKQKKRSEQNRKKEEKEEPELKLQCVLEWEMEQAKDARELAVTFTERFLKVKDGSCRPLISQFSALAREELKRKKNESGDSSSDQEEENNRFAIIANNNNSNVVAVPSSPTKRILEKLTTKKKNNENDSPTRHNKISRLPRSSWHVDFSVQEPEKETWKWFTKKLYLEANLIGESTTTTVNPEQQQSLESMLILINEQSENNNNNFSSSLLKNITFSGCCKGFNKKKLKIPDPPSIEHQLKVQTQKENDLSEKLARKDSKVFQKQQQQQSSNNNKNNQNNNNLGFGLAEFLPVIVASDEEFSPQYYHQHQQQSNRSVLPPSLVKAESIRRGESFRLNSSSTTTARRTPGGANNNNNNLYFGGGDSPEPGDESTTNQKVLASVARFRSRRFDQVNALSKQSQEEQEMQRRVEEARHAREEEQKRRKILKLDSMAFLQCILDHSSAFFRDLANEDRLSISEIRLEHCKLPRIKTQEEIEAEILYKQMQQRFKENHSRHNNHEAHHHHHQHQQSSKNPFFPSSSFVDALEDDEEEEGTNDESTSLTNTNTNTATATPQQQSSSAALSFNFTPKSKTHHSTANATPSSTSLTTANIASRGGIISPFNRNLPLSVLLTPKQRKLQLDHRTTKKGEAKENIVQQQKQNKNAESTSSSKRNSLANSSTNGTAVPNSIKPLKVAFLEDDNNEKDGEKSKEEENDSSSSSSSESDDDNKHLSFSRDIEEDFADAFLTRFVLSQAKTLRVLSLHGTRLTQKFIHKLTLVLRSKQLEKLEHLDIGLCGIESIDDTPYTSKVMASALAHSPPSLKSLCLNGTAFSPNFVGVSFCAAVRANVNLRKVDCVGCDRGGTKFEIIIQQMLKERQAEVERLERAKMMRMKNKWMNNVSDSKMKRNPSDSVIANDNSNNQQQQQQNQGNAENDFDDENEYDEEESSVLMLQPSKSVRLIDDVVLF